MIIAEVGLNHLGDEMLAMRYVHKLAKMSVDGITFQVPSKTFFQYNNNKHLKLSLECIIDALQDTKSMGKKFGIAIGDVEMIGEFENHGVDFYKVLSKDINNDALVNELNKTNKKIFFSTGLSDFLDLSKLLGKIKNIKQRIELVHTNLGGKVDMECLSRIKLLKNKYSVPVGYGTHCKNKNAIYLSLAFKPDSLLFYVKIDEKNIYPDNDHAFIISEVPILIKNIGDLAKTIGSMEI